MTFSREQTILNNAVAILKAHLNPGKIILFGSRAKGKAYKNSDFDLAVDQAKVDITTERKIREELEKAAGLYKVDVVYLNQVDEGFKNLILKTGKVIYERRD